MNYQDIPFFIWSATQNDSMRIARILGRQLNTHIESGNKEKVSNFIKDANYFICFVFYLQNKLEDIQELIKECKEKCPLCPVLLFSDQSVSYAIYKAAVREGTDDILAFDKASDQIELRKVVLALLNMKWKAHRHLEKATKRVYDATVVTAHHEINQPLTVIMNAMTMIKIEIKKLGSDAKHLEKYIGMVIKSLSRIQDILARFKSVGDLKLKEYTQGVPMVQLQKQSDIKGKVLKDEDRKVILVVESNDKIQENIIKSIRMAGYHNIFVSNGYEAIRIIRTMMHKISAILININISRVEIDELKFELKVHNKSIPMIFHSTNKKGDRIAEVTESGLYKFILLPFTKNELTAVISQATESTF